VRTIGLIPHPTRDVSEAVRVLSEWDASHGASLLALTEHAARLDSAIETTDEADFVDRVDAVVALGGDGTMLGAMRLVAMVDRPIPVLGVNYGTLGFLVEIEPGELKAALDRLDASDFLIESHHALELSVDSGPSRVHALAFNDVAIVRMPGAGVVSTDLEVDGRAYGYYRGDGVVVATSAGSTAYNYAAGGPVLSPALAACVVTPLAPMTGVDRAVVLSADEPLVLTMGEDAGRAALEVDGRVVAEVHPGSRIELSVRRDAAGVIRFDPDRHAAAGMLKLSLLDLPLRRDQLLELVPENLRDEARARAALNDER
jgi:NAD+ kinase